MKTQKKLSPQKLENIVEPTTKKIRKRKKVKKKKRFNKRNKYLHLVLNESSNNTQLCSETSYKEENKSEKGVKDARNKKHKKKKTFQKLKGEDESKGSNRKHPHPRKEVKVTKKRTKKTNESAYKIRKVPLFLDTEEDDEMTFPSFNEASSNTSKQRTETTENNHPKSLDTQWRQNSEQDSELDNEVDLERMPCEKESKHKRGLTAPKDILQRSHFLKNRMLEHLKSSQFRYLNEKLYNCTGKDAKKIFEKGLSSFEEYHTGYQNQVAKWPVNPLKLIIEDILSKSPKLVVADFGCGDATLAKSVPNKVHSFDLVALNNHVIACNMARVPLQNEEVDVVVFCLSLMGTNLSDYIREGHRVLKMGGKMKIAEIESRFTDVTKFVNAIEQHGFQLTSKDENFKMFILFEFVKSRLKPKKKMKCELSLKPCLYKKR